MKMVRKIYSLWIVQLLIFALALPVAASAYVEYEGLEVTVTMDQEQYDVGEAITATLTVTNTNDQPVTVVNLEQLIPEGYKLVENSEASLKNITIQPGETLELQVSFEEEPIQETDGEGAAPADFWDTLLYGETWGIPNLLLAVIAAIAFAVFMFLT